MEIEQTFCIVDREPIPLDRAVRKSNTCSPECAKKLKAIRRAYTDSRRCRHCNKPSTPEERKAFQAFLRSNPEFKPPKRGRPKGSTKKLPDPPEQELATHEETCHA